MLFVGWFGGSSCGFDHCTALRCVALRYNTLPIILGHDYEECVLHHIEDMPTHSTDRCMQQRHIDRHYLPEYASLLLRHHYRSLDNIRLPKPRLRSCNRRSWGKGVIWKAISETWHLKIENNQVSRQIWDGCNIDSDSHTDRQMRGRITPAMDGGPASLPASSDEIR